jgi:hypothetical protein
LDLEQRLRGTIAGFMMPSFVVDLPGGGGKRLAAAHEKYDSKTGVSTFRAPGLSGEKGQRIYEYYDPKPIGERLKEAHRELPAQDHRPQKIAVPPSGFLPPHLATPYSQPAVGVATGGA